MGRSRTARIFAAVALAATLAWTVGASPAAAAPLGFYLEAGAGQFLMDDVNQTLDTINATYSALETTIEASGWDASFQRAPDADAGLTAAAGLQLSVLGLDVSLGYEYLRTETGFRFEASGDTGDNSGTQVGRITLEAGGPAVGAALPLGVGPLKLRFMAGMGSFTGAYGQSLETTGIFGSDTLTDYREDRFEGTGTGYRAGVGLRVPAGPSLSFDGTVGYQQLVIPSTHNAEGDAGPALDFSGVRLQGALVYRF